MFFFFSFFFLNIVLWFFPLLIFCHHEIIQISRAAGEIIPFLGPYLLAFTSAPAPVIASTSQQDLGFSGQGTPEHWWGSWSPLGSKLLLNTWIMSQCSCKGYAIQQQNTLQQWGCLTGVWHLLQRRRCRAVILWELQWLSCGLFQYPSSLETFSMKEMKKQKVLGRKMYQKGGDQHCSTQGGGNWKNPSPCFPSNPG